MNMNMWEGKKSGGKMDNKSEIDDLMNGRKDTNDFMIFNDRRNTNELGELDILNLDLNVFQDDILKIKKDDRGKFGFNLGRNSDKNKHKNSAEVDSQKFDN